MIITRTPLRISFAGGGSDLAEFYRKHDAAVLSVTINKYVYLASHPHFTPETILLKYRKTEEAKNPREFENVLAGDILAEHGAEGLEIQVLADVPAQTGMGSSSSFAVGLHNLMYAYQNKKTNPEELARLACRTEIEHLKEPIGKQDQYAAAYGGMNFIKFSRSGKVIVEPVNVKPHVLEKLENNLLLFYTGVTRPAKAILEKQKENIKKSEESVAALQHMVEMAHHMKTELELGNLETFGKLLHDSWMLKQTLANTISNSEINAHYETAIKNGAAGGKLLGAGGGGFLLFYSEKPNHARLRHAMRTLREIPFKFSSEGSRVVFDDRV